jgi:hypothetical protein
MTKKNSFWVKVARIGGTTFYSRKLPDKIK